MKTEVPTPLKRQRIDVQGVGFRPFVYGPANDCGTSGFVLNDECGVSVEVEGPSLMVESFTTVLTERALMEARVVYLNPNPIPQNSGVLAAVRRR